MAPFDSAQGDDHRLSVVFTKIKNNSGTVVATVPPFDFRVPVKAGAVYDFDANDSTKSDRSAAISRAFW